MPYGQYENTSFNGQTFTLGNVGLTGATGPDLVSSDPSKPVRVNGIIPGAGGGGGGDVFTSTNNTYDAGIVNTFQGNTVMTTVGATGKITCVALDAGNGKIETTADVECRGLNAGNVKIETTDNLECATVIATVNVQCVDVVASGDVSCVGVAASAGVGAASLTTTGDINSGAGNIISGGTISGSSISTSSGSITSAGNIVATSGTGTIHGNSILSEGNITCGPGSNFIVGSAQIASSNLSDVNDLLNTSATAQTKAGGLTSSGQIQGDTLISTNNITSLAGAAIINQNIQAGGNIVSTAGNMEARGGQLSLRSSDAGIVDDASRNLTVQASTASNKIFCGLGSGANKALQLDILGTKARLRLYDYTVGRDQYYDVGQNPDELEGLITLINSSSLTFGGTTTTTFNGNIIYPQPSFTTFASGGYYVGSPTTFIDTASRFPVGILTETYGTTSKITMRGCCQLRAGGTIAANTTIASIPVGARPSVDVVVAVQGQTGSEQGRVDFLSNGNVQFIGPDATFTQINFSQISYFLV